jgi:RNA polymerase sigma factor (sigma-70 family)
MNAGIPLSSLRVDTQCLSRIKRYLSDRAQGQSLSPCEEAAWKEFYDSCTRKVRAYAYTCGTVHEEIADCVQEVWRELIVRLPKFQLDPGRGQFDTWLFRIIQSKTADLRRSRKRHSAERISDTLQALADHRAGPGQALEQEELVLQR